MAVFLLLIFTLCLPCFEVEARSKFQIEKQRSLTDASHDLRVILPTTDNGFDCVDIYKQPAFQHPLLKNHKIQPKPTFFARNILQSRSFKDNFPKACPPGKVPIHKMTVKRNYMNSSLNLQREDPIQHFQRPGHHYATLDTTQNITFRGASASISAYNLSLRANQYSMSQIWLQNGPSTELNIIQIGLGVHPSLYGDSQLRLTTYWTADGYNNSGCFNSECPGFIQVSSDYGLGVAIENMSTIGSDDMYDYRLQVKQDKSTGHWWLISVYDDVQIGYWAKEIFTHLNEGLSLIRYGGETFAPPNMLCPPMGSGRLPKEKATNSAYMALLEIVDSEYNQVEVKPQDMKSYCDTRSNCYDLWYHGYEGEEFHQAFLFGGPGGDCDGGSV